MRVVLNASTTIGPKTGIGQYTEEVLRCLRERLALDELFAFPHAWIRKLSSALRRGGATPAGSAAPSISGNVRTLFKPLARALRNAYARTILRPSRFDLYHEPNYNPVECDIPTVTTIHDLSIIVHPEWHPKERLAYFEKHFARGLRQARHFLADSEYARREMIELLNIPASKITCAYCGIRPGFAPLPDYEYRPVLRRLGLPDNYLLHVGTIEPRKNLLRLMRAYVDLPSEIRGKHPLVLAGQWGWRCDETALYFHSTARHQGVIQTGYLPDEDLPAVYNGARALVFPTLYEGFGIPVVEMMGCGGAVLASNTGAVAEVADGHADLIEPENIAGWRDAMQRVLTDDDWWKRLRTGVVERARQFSWDRTADATLSVYRQVLGLPSAREPVPFTDLHGRSALGRPEKTRSAA